MERALYGLGQVLEWIEVWMMAQSEETDGP